jgi:hypothetical protein
MVSTRSAGLANRSLRLRAGIAFAGVDQHTGRGHRRRTYLWSEIMEPGEALSTAAQVAVTLAGFAGVVVVFRSDSVHDWSLIDKFRLRLLLNNSILPLTLCMVGILLLTINPISIWRWCSAFAAVLLFWFAATTTKVARAFTPNQFRIAGASQFILYSGFALGTAATLLQVCNVVLLGTFWPFFTAIVIQLLAGMLQFVRLIVLPPHQDGGAA